MGVKNLWDILESCKQTLPLHHLQNKRLCVDLSCWLVQLQNAGHRPPGANDKLYLRNLFHRFRALIALNCSLILVADGSIPAIKLSTYRRRLGAGSEAAQMEENLQGGPLVSLRRNRGSEFSCMIKEAKVLGRALGIPCLDGLEEAEAQCALLNAESLCDGCFSSDSDIFLFGARTVYRDIFLGEGGYVTCYEMVDIEQKLGFGRNSLISLALLLGSDYSHGVNGFGRESACQIVKSLGENTVLHQIISEGLAIAKKYKGKKKTIKNVSSDANKENEICQQPNVCADRQNGGSHDEYMHVINAYLKPKCHFADSEIVKRACAQHPFLRSQLHEVCEQYFDWSPEKTDQYILPKIAERDLRRFTNLRSMLSESEIIAPLHKIPVPCPVSAIIKERKVQGQEFYEVSWRDFDGIQSSTVPVSLVESACPEKIVEFMEKKAEGRKQNRKPRKSSKAAVAAVDLQLQGLLLSIESQSSGTSKLSKNVGPSAGSLQQNTRIRETTKASQTAEKQNIEVDLQPQCLLHSIESQSHLIPLTSKSLRSSSSSTLPSEVIDIPVTPKGVQPADRIPWHNRRTDKPTTASETENMLNFELNLQLQSPHTDESQSHIIPQASKGLQSAGAHTLDSHIIDLCSPSPPLNVCKVGKGQKTFHQHVDVIDIYESENDVTPDHAMRARELRLFIDSMKEDLY